MNTASTKKRSFLSAFCADETFKSTCFAIFFFIGCPIVGYICDRLGFPIFDAFDKHSIILHYLLFLWAGFLVSAMIFLISVFVISAISFIFRLGAMSRSTRLPLTKEEIEKLHITTIHEYLTYIYEHLRYFSSFSPTPVYRVYMSQDLLTELRESITEYFGSSERYRDADTDIDVDIDYLLATLFADSICYINKTMTDDMWEEILENTESKKYI